MSENNTQLLERVLQAKRLYKLSAAKIAHQAGMAVSTAQNQLFGRYKLDIDILSAVLALCPDLSAEWLMRGAGTIRKKTIELSDIIKRIEALEQKNKE